MLDSDDLAVLRAVLRTRRLDPAALARIRRRRRGEVEHALSRLEHEGFLTRADGELAVRPPQEPLLADAASVLRSSAARLDELGMLLEELPALMRDWEWGDTDDERAVGAEVIHGPTAMIDAWWRYADRTRPVTTVCVAPDARAFTLVPAEDLARLVDITRGSGGVIRIIVGRGSVDDESAAALSALGDVGLEFRALSDPPSWFFADRDSVAALPNHWGESMPTSVTLIRHPVIADALGATFAALWARARPILGGNEPWDPILELLDRGMTDEEVADELGLSARTVRRRIADAMDELGATNRFTLGRMWAGRAE